MQNICIYIYEKERRREKENRDWDHFQTAGLFVGLGDPRVKEEWTERGVALRLGHAIYYVLGTYVRIYVLAAMYTSRHINRIVNACLTAWEHRSAREQCEHAHFKDFLCFLFFHRFFIIVVINVDVISLFFIISFFIYFSMYKDYIISIYSIDNLQIVNSKRLQFLFLSLTWIHLKMR